MIDRVIWDWNGTLLNDVNLNCALMNRMLRRRGMPVIPDLDHYRRIFQFPIREYYRAAGFDFRKESYEALAAEYLAEYPEESLRCPLAKGAAEALTAFREAGIAQSGADPAGAVLIGDTDHDWETAKALGCRCVLTAGGHQSRQALEALGVPVLDDLFAVRDWVLARKEEG